MSILVDYSQGFISNIMAQPSRDRDIDTDLIRHMVLNSLRSYRQKFCQQFGELIICCDSRQNWRKSYFKHYKANRKTARQRTPVDWNLLFQNLNQIKDELIQYFPYPVIEVEGAEADDLIGTICYEEQKLDNLILSGDKDFQQLQKLDNVHQFNPMRKEFIRQDDPVRFLKEQILRGDRGDGIPNILSEDTSFVNGVRQTPLSSSKVKQWLDLEPEIFCDHKTLSRFRRNQTLIDLTKTPSILKKECIEQLSIQKLDKSRKHLLQYFTKFNLKNLTEHLAEF